MSSNHEARYTPPEMTQEQKERAQKLLQQALVVDAEAIALLMPAVFIPPQPINGVPYYDRAIAAGLTVMNTTLGNGGLAAGKDDLRTLLNCMYSYLAYFELHPDKLVHVERADDLVRAKRENKLGVIFGIQGLAGKLDGDASMIRILHKIGLRIAQLTNNDRGAIGCGAMDPNDTGLTLFGRGCVRELNRVGVVVDVAHAGEKTAIEAIELSTKPCIFSHANVRAKAKNSRNATDEMLAALAKNGGVIGLTAIAQFNQPKRGVIPTVDNLVDHVQYIADKFGIDHVGIGTDFGDFGVSEVRHVDFARMYPEMEGDFHYHNSFTKGFESVDDYGNLASALVRRGFDDEDILKVLGQNFQRVFAANWN